MALCSCCRQRNQKSFAKYHYNQKRNLCPLPEIKEIDYKAEPKIQPRQNVAHKLRMKHIEGMANAIPRVKDYACLNKKRVAAGDFPDVQYMENKASAFRWKWTRKLPVVPCHFQVHLLKYRRPPFENVIQARKCWEFSAPSIWVRPTYDSEFRIVRPGEDEDESGGSFGKAVSVL